MLKLDIRQHPPRSVWLVSSVAIGKDPQNNIVLNANGIDDFHLVFQVVGGDIVYLIDKSTQGTFVNGERVTDRVAIKSGDWVTAGDIGMEVIDPKQAIIENNNQQIASTDRWVLRAITGWLAGQEIFIANSVVVGKDPACDVTIPGAYLSPRHAEITVVEDKLHVKDLDSSSGTFVNGERITEADVVSGDEVRFDLLAFFVLGPDKKNKQENNRAPILKKEVEVQVDVNPAVRIGTAKPTSLGNSAEYVQAYNQQIDALKAEKKRQLKQHRINIILGWLIVLVVFIAIGAGIYYLIK